MGRKRFNPIYLFLGASLLGWLSIPRRVADRMRSVTVAACAPTWNLTRQVQEYLADRPVFWRKHCPSDDPRIRRLELENAMLRAEIETFSEWGLIEQSPDPHEEKEYTPKPLIDERRKSLAALMSGELFAIPCPVIYRSPTSWSNSMWVSAGEDTNKALGKKVVAKNSPVLSGAAIVGVIDFVGKRQSRVRLITDENLCPSVRVARDGAYLAKGEVHGTGGPLWRARGSILKGIGFNFDFEDEEGSCAEGVELLRKGDLLVTTGFDGVFPRDFVVGTVLNVETRNPGSFTYNIDVEPAATDLNHLKTVYVIPSRN